MILRQEQGDGLTLAVLSERGANHRILCLPNQDAAAFKRAGEDFVLSVSDGVGSCSRAGQGSKYAVECCVSLFEELKGGRIPFENGALVRELAAAWRARIPEGEADDYCATLKAVFKIGGMAKVVSLGDGFAALTSDGMRLLSPADETHFTNETRCLSARTQEGDFWTADFPLDTYKPYAVVCCTDGVANGLLPGTELSLVEDIEKEIAAVDLTAALRSLLEDISNYCFDDMTLGVVKYEREDGRPDGCGSRC